MTTIEETDLSSEIGHRDVESAESIRNNIANVETECHRYEVPRHCRPNHQRIRHGQGAQYETRRGSLEDRILAVTHRRSRD